MSGAAEELKGEIATQLRACSVYLLIIEPIISNLEKLPRACHFQYHKPDTKLCVKLAHKTHMLCRQIFKEDTSFFQQYFFNEQMHLSILLAKKLKP
jgi:hypothetical protein